MTEEAKVIEETKNENFENYIEQNYRKEMGFSLIINEMIKAQKPLVGHNLIYDVGFLYDQFIAPLPDTFLKFSECWREWFPVTYDTKSIAIRSELKVFRRTDLESLYRMWSKDETLKKQIKIEMGHEGLEEKAHDAGFDAYMTGIAFMSMTKHKELVQNIKVNTSHKNKKKSKKNENLE
jgi:poly(A)-specific ribonuclease